MLARLASRTVVEADVSAMGVATVEGPRPPQAQLPLQAPHHRQNMTLAAPASLEVVDQGVQANVRTSLQSARRVFQIQAEVDA